MSKKLNILNKVKYEEENLRARGVDSIIYLLNEVKVLTDNIDKENLKKQVTRAMEKDLTFFENLGELLKANIMQNITHSLFFNKMQGVIKCGLEVINNSDKLIYEENHIDQLIKYHKDNAFNADILGNYQLNCINAVLISTYYNIASKSKYMQLILENDQYSVFNNPYIQTTRIPIDIKNYVFIEEGNQWIIENPQLQQKELIYLHLGFSFGGSRMDSQYLYKNGRADDCTSSLARWLNIKNDISTRDLEIYYDNDRCETAICAELKEIIAPKASVKFFEIGDIYLHRTYNIEKDPDKSDKSYSLSGHTGVITQKYNETCFQYISYNRDVGKFDGLVYEDKCFFAEEKKKYMVFEILEDMCYTEDYFPFIGLNVYNNGHV